MRTIGLGIVVTCLALSGSLAAQDWPGVEAFLPDNGQIIGAQFVSGRGSFLGVGVAEINAERAKALKLKEERGVEITRVEENSPAAKAGLKVGDVVLEYNGQRIEGTEQFIRMVRETPPERQARLTVSREGATQTITAAISARKSAGFIGMPGFDQERLKADLERQRAEMEAGRADREMARQGMKNLRMDIPRAYIAIQSGGLGVEAEGLSGQLAEFFGVKEGVLVRSVVKDSVAEKAGVKAGDVITKVDDTSVNMPREITNALRKKAAKKTFPLTVIRNHKEMTVSVTLQNDQSMREIQRRIRTVGADTEL